MANINNHVFADNINNGIDQFLYDLINEKYLMEDGTIKNWIGNVLEKTEVKKLTETEYKITLHSDKSKYIVINDTDFHMLDKNNFIKIFDE